MGWSKINLVDPYEHHRMWGDEKYDLQGMLLKQAAMPTQIHTEDKCLDIWSDRIPEEWRAAVIGTQERWAGSHGAMDGGWFAQLPDEGVLYFAQQLVDQMKYAMTVTGVRIVRYTNRASGYPTHHFIAVQTIHEPDKRQLLYGQAGTWSPMKW